MTSSQRTSRTIILALAVFTALTVTTSVGAAQGAQAPAPAHRLVQAHTPRTLIIDITLTPRKCKVVVLNAAAGSVLPDLACTPGAIDTAVTQATIQSTICLGGYTASVRPASTLTDRFKTIELDHLVPLELGGASTATNLWPEPNRSGAGSFENPKDGIESTLKTAVCKGRISLAAAQNAIASNWVTAKAVLGLG